MDMYGRAKCKDLDEAADMKKTTALVYMTWKRGQ